MAIKQSQFIAVDEIAEGFDVPLVGANVNRRISKTDLFAQIRAETSTFIYKTIADLEAANLEANEDSPVYVRCEETAYRLYKITSLAAGDDDISLENGTTATLQVEARDTGYVFGPEGATDGHIAIWNGNTGEALKDGPALTDFATAAQGDKADTAIQEDDLVAYTDDFVAGPEIVEADSYAVFSGATGKLLKGGPSIDDFVSATEFDALDVRVDTAETNILSISNTISDTGIETTKILSVGLSQIGTLDLSDYEYVIAPYKTTVGDGHIRLYKDSASTGNYYSDSAGNRWLFSPLNRPLQVASIDALKAVEKGFRVEGQQFAVLSRLPPIFGSTRFYGGGTFYWDATSTEAEDGGDIFEAPGVATGRFKRLGASLVKRAEDYGIVPNDDTAATDNDAAYPLAKSAISGGGEIHFLPADYYFAAETVIDDGQSLIGSEGVTYRENQEGQTRFLYTEDVNGLTFNGFNSYRNSVKNIKFQSNLGSATSTKTGIDFSAMGGSTGTRGLANILQNVTVQDFANGINTATAGDLNWFYEWSNIKIFRCQKSLIIDGSNGASRIDGLHIDAAGGYPSGKDGVVFNNGNGIILSNYSIENCNNGLVWNGNDRNDRLYLNDGYFEGNSVDIEFSTNSVGQIYSSKARFAYFSGSTKNASILANSGVSVYGVFRDTTVKGAEDGSDGLIRFTQFASTSTRLSFDELYLDAVCGLWPDFSGSVAPVYIKLLNQDKNSNFVELYRDTVNPTRMTAQTQRVSSGAPNNDTFVITLPDGSSLDLKYSGATVRGKTAGAWNEWMWDGSAFQATP